MNPYEMVLGFKRNVPLDMLYEAQTTAQLKGLVSEPTRLELLSFVDDVDYEQEMMERESQGFMPPLASFEEEDE